MHPLLLRTCVLSSAFFATSACSLERRNSSPVRDANYEVVWDRECQTHANELKASEVYCLSTNAMADAPQYFIYIVPGKNAAKPERIFDVVPHNVAAVKPPFDYSKHATASAKIEDASWKSLKTKLDSADKLKDHDASMFDAVRYTYRHAKRDANGALVDQNTWFIDNWESQKDSKHSQIISAFKEQAAKIK